MKLDFTQYGFQWGAAKVERHCSDEKLGWVYLGITTPKPKECLHIYVTKTGKTIVYKNGRELK